MISARAAERYVSFAVLSRDALGAAEKRRKTFVREIDHLQGRLRRTDERASDLQRELSDAQRVVADLRHSLVVAERDTSRARSSLPHWFRISVRRRHFFRDALLILGLFQAAYAIGETALGMPMLQASGALGQDQSLTTVLVATGIALVAYLGFIGWYLRSLDKDLIAITRDQDLHVELRRFNARVGAMTVSIPMVGTVFWIVTGAIASGRDPAVMAVCAGFGVVANFWWPGPGSPPS